MTLDELIAALERATGPSIDLSWMIAGSPKFEDGTANLNVPHYTASLDAALTLVTEGYATEMRIWPGQPSFVTVIGTRWQPFGEKREMAWVHSSGDRRSGSKAATPAIALCIAALKARKK